MDSAALILAVIGFSIYKIIELFVRRTERLRLIEKASELNLSKNVIPDLGLQTRGFPSLKIGFLFVGVGVGCLIAFFIQFYYTASISANYSNLDAYTQSNISDAVSAIYLACICIFGGLGLLISYVIERKQEEKETLAK